MIDAIITMLCTRWGHCFCVTRTPVLFNQVRVSYSRMEDGPYECCRCGAKEAA